MKIKHTIPILLISLYLGSCVIGSSSFMTEPISIDLDNWDRENNIIYQPYNIPGSSIGGKMDKELYEHIINTSWEDGIPWLIIEESNVEEDFYFFWGIDRGHPILLIPPVGWSTDTYSNFIFSNAGRFFLVRTKAWDDSFRVYEIMDDRKIEPLSSAEYEELFAIVYDSSLELFHIIIKENDN